MKRNLVIGVVLSAGTLAAAWLGLRNATAPNEVAQLSTPPPSSSPIEKDRGSCAYVWAAQDLTELSKEVQAAIREIQPGAQARAEAFGENCVYQDGHADFGAMETDFFVTLEVRTLDDQAALGKLVRQTMELLLERFPNEKTPGPQPGRVTLLIESPDEQMRFFVNFTDYQALPPDISDLALFQALFKKP